MWLKSLPGLTEAELSPLLPVSLKSGVFAMCLMYRPSINIGLSYPWEHKQERLKLEGQTFERVCSAW